MKRLACVCLATVMIAGAGSVWSADPPAPGEPVHQGKPVSFWLAALEPDRPASAEPKQAEAEEAIHALGPDAIPSILRYRGGSRSQRLDVIRHACSLLEPEADVKLVDALQDSDPATRETALEVLPASALPMALDDITKLATDPNRGVRDAGLAALVRLAPNREETIAALIGALRETSAPASPGEVRFDREAASQALGRLGPKAKAAVPELTELLADPSDSAREAAAAALWKIERNPSVVPVLAECLDAARDYQTCLRVLRTLGQIGVPAKAAVPAIQKRIDDPGIDFVPPAVNLAQNAVEALARIDPPAAAQARKKLEAGSATRE